MHSLAFGTLKPFIPPLREDGTPGPAEEAIEPAQMDMTLNVMAHSLVYWTQDLVARGMLGRGSRIFSMTSEGSHRVVPNYGAVGAAKAALEAHTRQLGHGAGAARRAGQLHPGRRHRHPRAAQDPGQRDA